MAKSYINTSSVDIVLNDLKKALSTNVRGARAGYLSGDRGKKPYEEDNLTVAQVALWNELGTERIPARPFLRNANQNAKKRGVAIVKARMEENADVEQIANDIGLMLESEIKNQISRGTFKENAKSTIRRKGSSRPLIDTSNMLQSVHWGKITTGGDKIMD